MDAKATAKYLERRISEAVKEAEQVRKDFGKLMDAPLNIGSRSTSPHALDRLINAEAVAVAFLEIRDMAHGTLEEVGTDAFLEAVKGCRGRILNWLRTSRVENSGVVQVQAMAQHNAATKVLSTTDVIEVMDEEN
jgi:hypothetical protein